MLVLQRVRGFNVVGSGGEGGATVGWGVDGGGWLRRKEKKKRLISSIMLMDRFPAMAGCGGPSDYFSSSSFGSTSQLPSCLQHGSVVVSQLD
ncbi:conserved hypothetical protein [Ricinus communis]|uniref:Uncharacterized protein n=1 Tax=Ricinus communis TaxID=3988 RepID=B9SGF3_RICCO|nr:conserved hypothetical protein [Ricinus communis]